MSQPKARKNPEQHGKLTLFHIEGHRKFLYVGAPCLEHLHPVMERLFLLNMFI